MIMQFAPLIALYVVGIFAYVVYNARALPASVREMAAQDEVFAASVGLSTIGIALMWPIAVIVLGALSIKARLAKRRIKKPFFDRLESGEPIQAIVADMGDVGPEPELRQLDLSELPPPPPCSACGGVLDYGQARAVLNSMPAFKPEPSSPIPISIDDIEMYTFCGDCTGRITDGCTPTPHSGLIPLDATEAVDAEGPS